MEDNLTYHSRCRMLERVGCIISLDDINTLFNNKSMSPNIQFRGGLKSWAKYKMSKYPDRVYRVYNDNFLFIYSKDGILVTILKKPLKYKSDIYLTKNNPIYNKKSNITRIFK